MYALFFRKAGEDSGYVVNMCLMRCTNATLYECQCSLANLTVSPRKG